MKSFCQLKQERDRENWSFNDDKMGEACADLQPGPCVGHLREEY